MNTFQQSRALSSASAALILDNRDLLWYPTVAGILAVIVRQGHAMTLGRVLEDGRGGVLGYLPVAILVSLIYVLATSALAAEAGKRFRGDFSSSNAGMEVALDRFPAVSILSVMLGVPHVALVAIDDVKIVSAIAVVLLLVELAGAGVIIPIIVAEPVGLAETARLAIRMFWANRRALGYGAIRYIAGVALALLSLLVISLSATAIFADAGGGSIFLFLLVASVVVFVTVVAFLTAQWTAFCVAVHHLESGYPVRGHDASVVEGR